MENILNTAIGIKLCETRHDLVSYLHKVSGNDDLDKNNKWQEIKKEIAKIDELLEKIINGKH